MRSFDEFVKSPLYRDAILRVDEIMERLRIDKKDANAKMVLIAQEMLRAYHDWINQASEELPPKDAQ